MVTKKKVIEIEVTQKMCDELNELQEKLFGNLNEETKNLLGIKKFEPCKLKALFG
jgi:hypothetical protein